MHQTSHSRNTVHSEFDYSDSQNIVPQAITEASPTRSVSRKQILAKMQQHASQLDKATIDELNDPSDLEEKALEFYFAGETKLGHYTAAKALVKKFSIITDALSGTIRVYDNKEGYYTQIGEEVIKNELSNFLGALATRNVISEIINHIKNTTYKQAKEIEEAHPKNLLPLKNGAFDLIEKKLLPHSPNYMFIDQIPVYYEENAVCPEIEKFIAATIDPKDANYFYDEAGLCLTEEHLGEWFFIHKGEGENGKTILFSLLQEFIGKNNCSTTTIHQLCTDRFAPATLHRKRANFGGDISDTEIQDTSILKSTVGNDRITVQAKFGHPYSMLPYATQIYSANRLPKFKDDSRGMYRRIVIVNHPQIFGTSADAARDPSIKLKDPKILDRICQQNELNGLFVKAINALENIRKTGHLSIDRPVEERKLEYSRAADSVSSFLNECCSPAIYEGHSAPAGPGGPKFKPAEGWVSKDHLYEQYCHYCKLVGARIQYKDWFFAKLKKVPEWNLELGNIRDYNGQYGDEFKVKSVRGLVFNGLPEYHSNAIQTDHADQNAQTDHSLPNTSLQEKYNIRLEMVGLGSLGWFGQSQRLLSAIKNLQNTESGAKETDLLKTTGFKQQELLDHCNHLASQGDIMQCRPQEWRLSK